MFITGLVFDGADDTMTADVNYQADTHSVTLTFSGFESSLHGIVNYDWAIGTQPGLEDLQPFIEHGVIHAEEVTVAGDGEWFVG